MRIARRVLWVAITAGLVVAGVAFVGRNRASVPIDLGVTTYPDTPLWQALLAAFAAGAALVALAALWQVLRLGMLSRRYRKQVARLEAEIHQLRNLPLSAEGGAEGMRGYSDPGPTRAAARDG
jgi:uncharacterized integral membrane protein